MKATGAPDEVLEVQVSRPLMPGLQLVAVGLDHRTAAIDLRDRVAFPHPEIPAALAQLTGPGNPLFEQAAILSTCNRVEVYGVARSWRSREELTSFVAHYHGLEASELEGSIYVHRDAEVAHHLAETSAGMHSLVLGEAQIQAQVRRALEYAIAAGTAGTELRRLFESAISAGRQVRSRTALAGGIASAAQASIELVRQRLGTLSQATVLLIGAGTTGELVAKHLMTHRPRELLVLSRGSARAARLAERYGATALTSDQLEDALVRSDVVISSTGARYTIVHRCQLEQALVHRAGARSRRRLLIDLSTPRDVEPAVAGLAGVELYTIDDLRLVVERTLAQRSAELPAAYSIIRAHVARFTRWLSHREAEARRRSLSIEVEEVRAAAVECALGQLPRLSSTDRELLDEMTRGLALTVLQRVVKPQCA